MKEARQAAKALAFKGLQDEVREVLRDEIRKDIQQFVRDNVQGAAEAMTLLLPKAIAGLAVDLEDPDPVFRQRATNLVLKYTMDLGDKGEDGDDARIINIIHGIPVPETTLGDRVAETIDVAVSEVVDTEGWERCKRCGEEKHPDAGNHYKDGFTCRACIVKQKLFQPGDNYQLADRPTRA